MKKSQLSSLFDEDASSSDKSLLTYQRPHPPETGQTDNSLPSANVSPVLPSTKHPNGAEISNIPEKSQDDSHLTSETDGRKSSSSDHSPTAGESSTPELLHSSVVAAFTFSGSQSVSLGSLGCAVYWERSRRRSVLVLYRSQQQQICLLTLTASSLPAIQPHNYVSFCCDAGRQYSIHVASQEALKEFVMKAVLAAAQAVDGSSPVALLLASEDHTKTAGGRCAREGDQLTLNVSEWGVQDPRSRPLRQLHSPVDDSGPLLGSWRSSLRGARPGQRWVVADPTSLGVVREVSVTGVRPAPRRPPLRLPTDDGGDWRPGEEPEEELEEAEGCLTPESPPSPPSSPLLPVAERDRTASDVRETNNEASSQHHGGRDEGQVASKAKGRPDVLARMARLGQQMFPVMGKGTSPSPPPSPPPSPARRSPTPAVRSSSPRPQSPSETQKTSSSGKEVSGTTAALASEVEGGPASRRKGRAPGGPKPTVTGRRPPVRLPPCARPPVAARADGTELGLLLGRLEAKLETVLTRLEPPVGVETDAEALAAGVRRLATENAALREASRGADRATELRLEAERARAAMTSELADSLAALTDTKRKLAETERRLAAAEEKAVAAEKREEELRMKLTAAQSACTAAGKETPDATRDTRRMLKGVYKTLVARLPPDETFTGAAVAEVAAEVVREALQRTETGRVEGRRTPVTEKKEERSSAPPFVAEDECVEAVD
ncbi:uncharacterized protein LOC122394504 [Amphibalanus amphitrite]|uniref:uncharacterized protein LOC122394504 n=1 Tax=Amphibalanus amphitrite TaxID=1232801 RepID=UPI001C9076BE|nr:uncharacterized protein LOC122394504 [Amphibalanus amphitrite]XP_043247348.1 uncharacterized protein LOC122394504 [Amphibalanus amphitrite]